MNPSWRNIETQVIHAGEPSPRVNGAVCLPIYQSAMFLYSGEQSYHDLKYIRLNNTPNHEVLHKKLAALESGEAALVTASGMAAITTSLLTLLEGGGHLLAQDCLYGGTHDFLTKNFSSLGLSYSLIDANAPQTWEKSLRPNTKAIYVETMTNPTLQVADLEAAVKFAKAHGLISLIDNTFASPVNFNPLAHGFDLALHSCTKYLNGHSDLVAGAVVGRADLIQKITHLLNHLGGSLDPHACFLLHRGMKTLALRVRYQNESALQLARFLAAHPKVESVNYPGLPSHPHHDRARRLFRGFSGMMSFELKGDVAATERFVARLQLPLVAPSLGGVETLVTRPATTSHSGMAPAERQRIGISDKLVRVSVGIEATTDLVEDFKQALEG
ncbi:aminotransferase class I/II-fold pyridoxal phosphate-dependent enzyme [candidate division KSB1 bacterium]|nr:aminotransferase class I/II-fold pyridoxal phosphate-dependent enzyme [candidate division KSB1 bacterium]